MFSCICMSNFFLYGCPKSLSGSGQEDFWGHGSTSGEGGSFADCNLKQN